MNQKLYRIMGIFFLLVGIIMYGFIITRTVFGMPLVHAGPLFSSYALAFGGCMWMVVGFIMYKGSNSQKFRSLTHKPLAFAMLGAAAMRILSLGNEQEFVVESGWVFLSEYYMHLVWYLEISLFSILSILFFRIK